MSDGSEKRPLTKMLWSVSIKTRTFASFNTCNGSFKSCLKLLKQYRTLEQMCSDAHSITLKQIRISLSIHITQIKSPRLYRLLEDIMKLGQLSPINI